LEEWQGANAAAGCMEQKLKLNNRSLISLTGDDLDRKEVHIIVILRSRINTILRLSCQHPSNHKLVPSKKHFLLRKKHAENLMSDLT
jgi:hypothetical protein